MLRRLSLAGAAVGDVDSARTDAAGRFGVILFGGLRSPGAALSVCAPGYAPHERPMPDQARARGLTIALTPAALASGGVPSQAPPCS